MKDSITLENEFRAKFAALLKEYNAEFSMELKQYYVEIPTITFNSVWDNNDNKIQDFHQFVLS
jgi:hypothetical protein